MPLFDITEASGSLGAGVGLFYLPDGAVLPGLALLPYAKGSFDKRFEIADQLFLSINSDLDMQGGIGLLVRPSEPIKTIVGLNDTKLHHHAGTGFR